MLFFRTRGAPVLQGETEGKGGGLYLLLSKTVKGIYSGDPGKKQRGFLQVFGSLYTSCFAGF